MSEEVKQHPQKITSGHHATVLSRSPRFNGPSQWKYGVPVEVYQWLTKVVGETVSNPAWELEGKGDWIHTGASQIKAASRKKRNLLLNFWFRDPYKAALFVIRWDNQL